MHVRYLASLAVATASAAASPAAAFAADDRFVNKALRVDNATCAAATPCLTINHAVSVADAADTIHIGPGFYDEAVVADDRMHFEGAGAGDPTSLFTPGTTRIQPLTEDGPAIELRDGGTVRDLQLVGKANPSPTNRPGLLLTTAGGGGSEAFVVENVNAFGGEAAAGTRREGIRIDDDGTGREMIASLQNLTVTAGATDDGSDGLVADGPNVTASLEHATIRALSDKVRFALWSQHGAELDLTETTMPEEGQVVTAIFIDDAPGQAVIDRSDLRANGKLLHVVNGVAGQSQALVTDSVLANVSGAPTDPAPNPAIQLENTAGGDARIGLRGVTVLSRRPKPRALAIFGSGPGDATASVVNTLLRATSTTGESAPDVYALPNNGLAGFAASHSSFSEAVADPPLGAGSTSVTAPGAAGNLDGDPGLVDEAGGNLRLGADSQLVDRGALIMANTFDVTGGPRVIDGDGDGSAQPDIGAYEREFISGQGGGGGGAAGGGATGSGQGAGTTAGGPPGSTAAAGVRVLSFGLSKRRFRIGRKATALSGAARRRRQATGTAFRFALSGPATATIAISRTVAGTKRRDGKCGRPKRSGKRCKRSVTVGTLTRKANAGATSVPFSGRLGRRALSPGSYKATLAATGADGARSDAKTVRFRVVR